MMIPRISGYTPASYTNTVKNTQNFKGEFQIKKFENLVNYSNNTAIVHAIVEYRPYLHDTDEIQAKEKQDYTEWLKSQPRISINGKIYNCFGSCSCTIYDGPRLDYDRIADWNLSIAKPQKEQRKLGNDNKRVK